MTISLGFAQQPAFYIGGKFRIDGGSNKDAKIVIEKDGRKVQTISGDARFEIPLDFQALYVVSFEKEGYVTKKLQFDTHVPEGREQELFEIFDFTIEIFEQFDDINTVVFNQPVGQISYDDVIDAFDYDTDYTKSIQAKIEQVMKEVEEKKIEIEKEREEQQKKEEQLNEQVEDLTSSASKNLSGGNYQEAIDELKQALELKGDPAIEQQLQDAEQKLKEAQEQDAKQKQFDDLVAQANEAKEETDFEKAKDLYNQANAIIADDPKVKKALEDIAKKEQAQAESKAEQEQLIGEAQAALEQAKPQQALDKLADAKKLGPNDAIAPIEEQANKVLEENAKAEAEAEAKSKELDGILSEAEEKLKADEISAAKELIQKAKEIGLQDARIPELETKILDRELELQEEQKAEEEAEQAFQEAIASANEALDNGNISSAKDFRDQAKSINAEGQLDDLDQRIKDAELSAEKEKEELEQKAKEIEELKKGVKEAIDRDELTTAESLIANVTQLAPDDPDLPSMQTDLQSRKDAIAAAERNKEKIDELNAEGIALVNEGNLVAAKGKIEEIKSLEGDASPIEMEIEKFEEGLAEAENEAKEKAKKEEELVAEVNEAIEKSDVERARTKIDELKGLSPENQIIESLELALNNKQDELNAAKANAEAQQLKIDDLQSQFEQSLDAKEIEKAEQILSELESLGADLKPMQKSLEALRSSLENEQQAEADKQEKINALIQQAKDFVETSSEDKLREAIDELASLDPNNPELDGLKSSLADLEKINQQKAADQASAEKLEEINNQYDDLISKAEKSLEKQDLDAAKTQFEQAAKLKPEERYPREKLAEVDRLIAEKDQAKQQEVAERELEAKRESFQDLIEKGDNAKEKEEYEEAKKLYNEAMGLDIDNEKVRSKLAEIESIEAELANEREQQTKESAFDSKMKQADDEFSKKNLERAKQLYAEALEIKPGASVAERQLTKVQDLIDQENDKKEEELSNQAQFEDFVSKGDQNLAEGQLSEAENNYKDALAIVNDEEVKQKLARVTGEIEEEKRRTAAAEEAANALATDRQREREQLQQIIEEESQNQEQERLQQPEEESRPQKMANATLVEEDNPVVKFGEVSVGEDVLKESPAASLSEEEMYDQQMNLLDKQQARLQEDERQLALSTKYQQRRTVETETIGNSVVTYVYINREGYVTQYKKVEHNWGGVFYFVDDRSTNQRFWEHETQ